MPGYRMKSRGTARTPLPQARRLHLSAWKSRSLGSELRQPTKQIISLPKIVQCLLGLASLGSRCCLLLLRYPSNTNLGSPHNRSRSFQQQKDLLLQLSYSTDCAIWGFRSLHTLKSAMANSCKCRIKYCIECLLKPWCRRYCYHLCLTFEASAPWITN